MWLRLFSVTICLIVQPNVFCNAYKPVLDDHGGTAALHISATNLGASSHRCGAILISDRHLLTAASCVKGKESEKLVSISLGREDLDQNPSPGKNSYNITDAFIHPDFGNGKEEYNDLAILKTDRKVQYSNKVWPYCLPEKNQTITPYKPVQIAGWGYVNLTHKTSEISVAYVKLMTLPRCESEWRKHAPKRYENILQFTYPQGLNERLICAGRQGVDACIGDSGGPMSYQNKYGRHISMGLIAKRIDCPDLPTTPGFYTNLAHYLEWIYATTGRSKELLSEDCGGPPRPATAAAPQQPADVEADESTDTESDTEIVAGEGYVASEGAGEGYVASEGAEGGAKGSTDTDIGIESGAGEVDIRSSNIE